MTSHTTPSVTPDNDLLDRYLANECAPYERQLVESWATSQERALRFSALRSAATDPFSTVPLSKPAQVLQRFWTAVDAVEKNESPMTLAVPSLFTRRSPLQTYLQSWIQLRRVWWPTIASVALVAVAIFVIWRSELSHNGRHKPIAVATYVTAKGERATITLPDGSTAALDVASRLDVPVDYATGNHMLRLQGRALFTVLHHSGASLTVIAGSTTARVLGTSFVMRHYDTDSTTTVAVRDGKVAVHSLVLTENQQAEFGLAGTPNVRPARAAQFSFAAGVLTLDGLLLSDAIPELNRWYDADVRIGDPKLARQRLVGDLPSGSLAELASLLEWTFNMRVVREGRVLTLFPR